MIVPQMMTQNFEEIVVASDSSGDEEIEIILSLQGIKNTHFNLTPLNEIFMGTTEGHL